MKPTYWYALRVPRVGINNAFSVKEYFNLINCFIGVKYFSASIKHCELVLIFAGRLAILMENKNSFL